MPTFYIIAYETNVEDEKRLFHPSFIHTNRLSSMGVARKHFEENYGTYFDREKIYRIKVEKIKWRGTRK